MDEKSASRLINVLFDEEHNHAELNNITEAIIGCAFKVSNKLGTGFLEKVYENALAMELRKKGLSPEQQKPLKVFYEGEIVGNFFADLVVEGSVIVELKHSNGLDPAHKAQCLNYLRATGLKLCLLINFGKPRIEIRRIAN